MKLRGWLGGLLLWVLLGSLSASAQTNALLKRAWFEARTTHFRTFSCASTQEVARVVARLEQFHQAYATLAGNQAVASPPIVVMAFPDQESLTPFLPVYQGKPANLAGFFHRGSDENLIVLALSRQGPHSMETIFHEYSHLLLRHNQNVWPLWLKEGMADIYSTFQVSGERSVRIGHAMEPYMELLTKGSMMPLSRLFAVDYDSPEYNERERQGVFYAQSWLLTHYLMLGHNPLLKERFGQLTVLLRQGQTPEQAFTNAFSLSLPLMERQLRFYLEKGRFEPLSLSVSTSLSRSQAFSTRPLSSAEVCFRLGDQLLRVDRADSAETWFERARSLAPASPLPWEGLGLLAAERERHAEAMRCFEQARQRGPVSFLAHYLWAHEKLRSLAVAPNTYSRLASAAAADLRAELHQALNLMPDFGPAHRLLGIVELVQQDNLALAEEHLQRAILLEPENQAYLLSLAQAQILNHNLEGARRTLEPLRRPSVKAELRSEAERVLRETAQGP